MKLFIEKGYEKTTIQDIVDELGMSKGAIYHHFKSKEDIIEAIWTDGVDVYDWKNKLEKISFVNAKEKLETIFTYHLTNKYKQKADAMAMPLLENPKFLTHHLHQTLYDVPPIFAEIFKEGNADGSLNVEQPKETAEIMCLLINTWINPMVFSGAKQEVLERVKLFSKMMLQLGINIDMNKICNAFLEYYDSIYNNNEE